MTHTIRPSKVFAPTAAVLSFVSTLIVASSSLEAGRITAWAWDPTAIASVALDPIPPLADPNNDNVAGFSPNTLTVTQKAIFGIGPVDIEFTVVDSGGTTEYTIIEGPSNGTGIPWTAHRIELGFGLGGDFEISDPNDGLDFDAPDFDSPPDFSGSSFFTTVSESEDVLIASGGIFPIGGFPSPEYTFNIDVPDGITSFTMRQRPVGLPEPSALLLAGMGLVALAFRTRYPN